MICVLNCVRNCFRMPGKLFFYIQFAYISHFIDSPLSTCLPVITQQITDTTEADDEAAMLAEFEANFS